MLTDFDLDACLVSGVTPAECHVEVLQQVAAMMGYRGVFVVDVNLCDPCMDAKQVDKSQSWMGHREEGRVRCDRCGSREARLCFVVRQGI